MFGGFSETFILRKIALILWRTGTSGKEKLEGSVGRRTAATAIKLSCRSYCKAKESNETKTFVRKCILTMNI